MKIVRGKKPASSPAPEPTPKTAAPPVIPPRAPASARNKTRVLLTVSDGKIDWAKMTPESRKQFEEMFANPEFLKAFGLSSKTSEWDPEQVKALYDGLGMVYQNLGRFILGLPPQAIAVLGFSNAEKEALAKPTAAMADAYSGEFLKKHQALVVWGAIFFTINATKIKAALSVAQHVAAQQRLHAPGAQTPRAPQPAPRPVPRPDPIPEIVPVAPPPKIEESHAESLESLPIPVQEGF